MAHLVVTSRCGGWLEHNTIIPTPTNWDHKLEMEIKNNEVQPSYTNLRSYSNNIFATHTKFHY